jgi:hypothetical protein
LKTDIPTSTAIVSIEANTCIVIDKKRAKNNDLFIHKPEDTN